MWVHVRFLGLSVFILLCPLDIAVCRAGLCIFFCCVFSSLIPARSTRIGLTVGTA